MFTIVEYEKKNLKLYLVMIISLCLLLVVMLIFPGKLDAKKSFNFNEYKFNEFIIPFSSSRLLTSEDLHQIYLGNLNLAKNEIYARHGYRFKDKELNEYFSSHKWYQPVKNFNTNSLSKIEENNVKFIQEFEKSVTGNVKKYKELKVATDMNFDGKVDKVSINFGDKNVDEGWPEYQLKVNNAIANGKGDSIIDELYICDLNVKDKFKEIAIVDAGPSDDYTTTFFHYDGQKLTKIGVISGDVTGMYIDGSGKFFTKTRGMILQTWFYSDEYELTYGNIFKNNKQNYYKMNTNVTLKMNLDLSKSVGSQDKFVVKKGTKAAITLTDDKKWCKLVTSDGSEGWFSVSKNNTIEAVNKDGNSVFDGLCFAD